MPATSSRRSRIHDWRVPGASKTAVRWRHHVEGGVVVQPDRELVAGRRVPGRRHRDAMIGGFLAGGEEERAGPGDILAAHAHDGVHGPHTPARPHQRRHDLGRLQRRAPEHVHGEPSGYEALDPVIRVRSPTPPAPRGAGRGACRSPTGRPPWRPAADRAHWERRTVRRPRPGILGRCPRRWGCRRCDRSRTSGTS